MLPAFVLFLREGLEASMIVSILLAALAQVGRPRALVRAVWLGVALALAASALGGTILYLTLRDYAGSTFQTVFETATFLIAVVILTTMTFWMQRHSRTLKREITAQAAATGGSAVAIGVLSFTTVGREALESAVFTLAFAFKENGWLLVLGALLGVAASLALAVAIYRLGYRLDYRRFFRIMGLLLLLFAAGLLGDAVQNLQALGWLPIGTAHLWNTAGWLSEDSALGDLLHAFIGYAESPTLLQMLAYLGFLAIAGTYFARLTRNTRRPAPQVAPTSSGVDQPSGPAPRIPAPSGRV
jgi:high-affinity iron transporter